MVVEGPEVDISCPVCEQVHPERYLCDAGKAFFEAIKARAGSYTLEPMEFDQIPAELGQVADAVLRSFTVAAGTAEVGGVPRPLIILSGNDMDGKPLPRWLYIASIQDLQRARDLFTRMVSMAIDQARKQRGGR